MSKSTPSGVHTGVCRSTDGVIWTGQRRVSDTLASERAGCRQACRHDGRTSNGWRLSAHESKGKGRYALFVEASLFPPMPFHSVAVRYI